MTPERQTDLHFQAKVLAKLLTLDRRLATLESKIGAFELKKQAALTSALLLLVEAGKWVLR